MRRYQEMRRYQTISGRTRFAHLLGLLVMSPSFVEFAYRIPSYKHPGLIYSDLQNNLVFEITTSTNYKGRDK